MNITIIGTGYVGLTEGVCFAEIGHNIICYDTIEEKIEKLQKGIPTLYENGLEEILNRNLKNGRLNFSNDIKDALKNTDAIFICVGTPEKQDGSADLTYILQATESIVKNAPAKEFIFIVKSTVPVGTNKVIENKIKELNPNTKILMADNPEFSRQGFAIKDFLEPDRIIVGVNDYRAEAIIKQIYKPITDKGFPLFITDVATAELVKYASNGFLAIKIAFINEMANICEKTGANVQDVAMLMGKDKRISPLFLQAGPGVGGSCFPKDSAALNKIGKNLGLDNCLIEASVLTSKKRIKLMAEKIISQIKNKNNPICFLGLTFKANTDDLRCSPSLDIIKELLNSGVKVNSYDPQVKEYKGIECFDNSYKAMENAELLVIGTEWNEFKTLDYKKVYELLKNKIVIDLRNILHKGEMERMGFKYMGIGV